MMVGFFFSRASFKEWDVSGGNKSRTFVQWKVNHTEQHAMICHTLGSISFSTLTKQNACYDNMHMKYRVNKNTQTQSI